MRVLVTGAEGFVGGHLTRCLQSAGHDVVGGVLEPQPTSGFASSDQITLDVEQERVVSRVIHDVAPDAVVHLAGFSDVGASWKDLATTFRVNVIGTENVVRACEGRARVLLASSAEVYGKVAPEDLPLTEEAPLEPSTPYAMSKAAAERIALAHGAVVVRSFNLIGTGQSPRFALPSFAQQLARIGAGRQEPRLRVGNLEARRDFVHVEDGVEGYLRLLEADLDQDASVFNIASGAPVAIADALKRLIRISGVEVAIEQDPERLRPSDVPEICGDASRLRALGWSPTRDIDAALTDLWRAAREAIDSVVD